MTGIAESAWENDALETLAEPLGLKPLRRGLETTGIPPFPMSPMSVTI